MPTPVAIPVTEITRAGVVSPAVTAGDATNGHKVANDGSMYLTVDNSAGTTGTVTVAIPTTVDGQAVTSKAYTIPLTSVGYHIGPFPTTVYGATLMLTVSASTLGLRAWHLANAT